MTSSARVAARRPTARLRSLPDFLIIGGQRCGTTTLYRELSRHSGIVAPLRKEVQYFTLRADKDDAWYRAHFPTTASRARRQRRHGEPPLTFEATPYYLAHPEAAARAAATVPDAKLVTLLRNPIDRAFSHYQHTQRRGLEPLSFADALDAEGTRLQHGGRSAQIHSYATRGRYAEQLERWFAQFPRSQLLVMRSEDLFEDTAATVARVIDFLGLSPVPASARPGLPITQRERVEGPIRERLRAEFAPQNQALATLLATDVWWDD